MWESMSSPFFRKTIHLNRVFNAQKVAGVCWLFIRIIEIVVDQVENRISQPQWVIKLGINIGASKEEFHILAPLFKDLNALF
jgi:uncharacterized protein involved in cysteine biosynthesis